MTYAVKSATDITPKRQRKPYSLLESVMGELLKNVGQPISNKDLAASVGTTTTMLSAVVSQLINAGWEIAKPQRDQYLVVVVGQTDSRRLPQRGARRSNGVHSRGKKNPALRSMSVADRIASNDEKEFIVGRELAVVQPVVQPEPTVVQPVAQPVVQPELAETENEFRVGTLLEVVHISRAGTVIVEDENGQTFKVQPL